MIGAFQHLTRTKVVYDNPRPIASAEEIQMVYEAAW
jgi:hypothetical protein